MFAYRLLPVGNRLNTEKHTRKKGLYELKRAVYVVSAHSRGTGHDIYRSSRSATIFPVVSPVSIPDHQVGDRCARGPLLGPGGAVAGEVRVSGEALDFPTIVDASPRLVAGEVRVSREA